MPFIANLMSITLLIGTSPAISEATTEDTERATAIVATAPAPDRTFRPEDANAFACHRVQGIISGCAHFFSLGAHLYACDYRDDDRTVVAQIFWDGAIRASARDDNGHQIGCGHNDLSIADGTFVWIRACTVDVQCSDWVRGQA